MSFTSIMYVCVCVLLICDHSTHSPAQGQKGETKKKEEQLQLFFFGLEMHCRLPRGEYYTRLGDSQTLATVTETYSVQGRC